MADMNYPNLLAGGVTNTDIPSYDSIYAQSADVVTDEGEIGGTAVEQFRVLGRVTATGKLVPWNPAGADGSQKAVAIAAQAIAANKTGPIFTGGMFDHTRLVWPVAADTLAERKAAFDGSNIGVRQLL